MFRGSLEPTHAEEEMLEREVERIASMETCWAPTKEALCEVLLAVKAAGFEEHRAIQREAIRAAQERGVKIGRPKKEPPAHFGDIVDALERGELSKTAAAKSLDVSCLTLSRWLTERKEQKSAEPKIERQHDARHQTAINDQRESAPKTEAKLTEAEEQALEMEVERIAKLGMEWFPAKETLLEVLLAVKAAGFVEHYEKQRKGMEAARKRGTPCGRPVKELPSYFEDLAKLIEIGVLSKSHAAEICGITRVTLYRWLRKREERNKRNLKEQQENEPRS